MRKIILDIGSAMARTALAEDGTLTEILIDRKEQQSIVGNIYVGRVENIVPNQFAFVQIGREKNGFLQLDDAKQIHSLKGQSVKRGREILVQAVKDEDGDKGPALTTELSFTGRYMVLIKQGDVPGKKVNISSKITSPDRRKALTKLMGGVLLAGDAVILRTESQEAADAALQEEYDKLRKLSLEILEKSKYAAAPAVLHTEGDFYAKSLKNLLSVGTDEIITNAEMALDEIKALAGGYLPPEKIHLYPGPLNIFEEYLLENQIEKALREKVWLKSGGFLLIEETKTCTMIDVNTGKFVTKKDKEKTVIKNNLEAAEEIARQLRLRNISGMILIDFVDMKNEENKKWLVAHLGKELKKDRVPAKIVSYSSLNLVQLTRKNTRPSLSAELMKPCPACSGTGRVYAPDYLAERILSKVEKILAQTIYDSITIEGGKKVVQALLQSRGIEALQVRYGADIGTKIIETGNMDYFEIAKEKRLSDG